MDAIEMVALGIAVALILSAPGLLAFRNMTLNGTSPAHLERARLELSARIVELETEMSHCSEMAKRVPILEAELDQLREENRTLRGDNIQLRRSNDMLADDAKRLRFRLRDAGLDV